MKEQRINFRQQQNALVAMHKVIWAAVILDVNVYQWLEYGRMFGASERWKREKNPYSATIIFIV